MKLLNLFNSSGKGLVKKRQAREEKNGYLTAMLCIVFHFSCLKLYNEARCVTQGNGEGEGERVVEMYPELLNAFPGVVLLLVNNCSNSSICSAPALGEYQFSSAHYEKRTAITLFHYYVADSTVEAPLCM